MFCSRLTLTQCMASRDSPEAGPQGRRLDAAPCVFGDMSCPRAMTVHGLLQHGAWRALQGELL